MGQIVQPGSGGISVRPLDRQSGPSAGAGSLGDRTIFLGQNAGENSNQSDSIAIGYQSLFGAPGSASYLGFVALGSLALQNLGIPSAGAAGGVIAIGRAVAQQAVTGNRIVAVGDGVLSLTTTDIHDMVAVGDGIAANQSTAIFNKSVVIGSKAGVASGAHLTAGLQRNVIIGSNALSAYQGAAGGEGGLDAVTDSVIIGDSAATALVNSQVVAIGSGTGNLAQGSVAIGYLAAANGQGDVMIGASVTAGQADTVAIGNGVSAVGFGCTIVGNGSRTAARSTTIVGQACIATGEENTLIGQSLSAPGNATVVIGAGSHFATGDSNIVIGWAAGSDEATATGDILIFESRYGGVRKGAMFADMLAGNVVLGKSAPGTDRTWGSTGAGTQNVKLLNGTKGTGNPVGGGYFYVAAGVLHWVDTAGVDSALSLGAGGVMLNSSVTLTNAAGAAAGTLTNAPTVGNPSKWITINDNGTVRKIPTWL
jgi:co-chaperonin GroES (HSP10)